MPSFWKKQRRNKFSRLVSDLQTPPKHGGSLVVETGFPTSLVDLFVKNRDKLKKRKTKKHKSKKFSAISEGDDSDYGKTSVKTHPQRASSCDFFGPSCSIFENGEQKIDNVDENVVNNVVTHETPVVELNRYCCRIGENSEKVGKEIVGISASKVYVILLSILMGELSFGVVFFAENLVVALIALGVLLLILKCSGKLGFGLFKNCGNSVWMLVLKVALVVVVGLNTKWFVAGITIGACLLILLESAGKSIFVFFKFCQNARGRLLILPHKRKIGEGRKVGRGMLTKAIRIGSKRNLSYDNGLVSESGVEDDDDGNVIALKGERARGSSRDSFLSSETSSLIDEENERMPINELNSKVPKRSDSSCSVSSMEEKVAIGRREEGGEDLNIVNHARKAKKHRKFWKKLVSRRSSKRKKHEFEDEIRAMPCDTTQDIATELGVDDEQKGDELEISEEGFSTSSLNEEYESGNDKYEAKRIIITEELQLDHRNTNSCGIVKEGNGSLRYFTAMVIPLTGLIGGRVFAIAVTVICCLVFKMVRRSERLQCYKIAGLS